MNIKKNTLTWILLLLTFFVYANKKTDKPNILFIISDDLRTELNCYGAEYIKSPNIDRLAQKGFLFTRAYCQQAVCAASRASFLSGCRPNTTGVDYPYSQYFVNEFWPEHPSIAEYFEKQGYAVRTIGKIHHGPADNIEAKHYGRPKDTPLYYALEKNIKLGGTRGRSKKTPPFEAAEVPDEAYQDGMYAKEGVRLIKELSQKEQPFFIAVGFKKPHLPFAAPQKYWDLYSRDDIKLSPNPNHPEGSPEYSTTHYSLASYKGYNDKDGGVIPEDYQKTLRHAYAACVSYIDAQVGKLIKQLQESGVSDNTVVMFIGDHGWHLGDQGMWGKTTNFENATLSPLIISVPGLAKGKRLNQLVEYVDIYPTLADLAGFQPGNYLEGTSFVPLLENPERKWKDAAFSQFPRGKAMEGFAIRTDNFRYVEWRDGKDNSLLVAELYDHRKDSLETINVANDEGYKEIVIDLAKQLKDGWKAALPDGITNNSNNPLAPPAVGWGSEANKNSAKKANGIKKD